MEGISIKPTTKNPSKLSSLSYKYIFERLMVARESELEFWIPIIKDLQKASCSWDDFRKMSFQITSTYDIQGDFTQEFKLSATTLLNDKVYKELLPRLMIKFANVFERKLTVTRLLEFLFKERIYFLKCLSAIFLNSVRDNSDDCEESDNKEEESEGENDDESGDVTMGKRKKKINKIHWDGICDELVKGRLGKSLRCLIFDTRSRKRIALLHRAQTQTEREQKKTEFYYLYHKLQLEELGEELDLLFLTIYSRKMKIMLDSTFQVWLNVLASGTMDPRSSLADNPTAPPKKSIKSLGFGCAYIDKFHFAPLRGEILRINALCVMNFLLMLQEMDQSLLDVSNDYHEREKEKFEVLKRHILRADMMITRVKEHRPWVGMIHISWATFLRRNWNQTLQRIFGGRKGEEVITNHFQKGMMMKGILYLRSLFGRKEHVNYPFFGHEQNLECYRTVVSNFVVSLLITMGDLPTLPYRFVKDIAVVQMSLLKPFSSFTDLENHFLLDYYRDYIDLDDDREMPPAIHPYIQLFHIIKTYLPSQLELLHYFGALIFDPGSAFTICSYLDKVKHFTVDFEKDEFDRVLKKERVSSSRDVQTIVPCLTDEIPPEESLDRFPEYRMLESYHDSWTGVTIPRGTRFVILSENEGIVLLGFYKVPSQVDLARRRKKREERKRRMEGEEGDVHINEEDEEEDESDFSLLRVLLRIFMNMKYRLMHDYDISRRYLFLMSFFERVLRHGSNHLMHYLDYQLFRLRNPRAQKNQMPRVHGSGLLFLQSLQELLGLAIDRLGARGGGVSVSGGTPRIDDRATISLIAIITGIWKCLNGFALKKPKEVMMMVMKFLSTFDQIVEIEGIQGVYTCVIELLEIIKTLVDKHSINLQQDVFYLVEWMAGNVFVRHMTWKYQGFTHRWVISLRCLEVLNKLCEYYSAVELECMIETLFFDPNNQCGQSLFLLLGQCRQWYKEITKKQRGDDVQLIVKLIEEAFKFVESLIRFKNEKRFMGRAIHLALEQLVGREQKPIIRILFKYTMELFPTDIRIRAFEVMRLIIEMSNPPSVVASLGSKGLNYIGKQLHYLQTEMEVTEVKVAFIRLITSAILSRQGLGQMYIHYDPSQFYYSEMEKRATKGGINEYTAEPLLNTYIKKKELIKGGYPSILINLLETFHRNDEELVQACLESIEAVFTSSPMPIRKIIRTNPKFWKLLFEMFENLSNEDQKRKMSKEGLSKQHYVVKSLKNILDIMTIDLYFGKLMNTYVDDPSVFQTFYLEFERNPGVFLQVLSRTIERMKTDLNDSCVNLVVLRRVVGQYNQKYRKRLNIEDFTSNDPSKVYDIDRLKRWKLRVLARREIENQDKKESDPVQKDIDLFFSTTRPEYDVIAEEEKEILELAEAMNGKYLLMNSYIKMLESFSSMFTVFVIPLQDRNKNSVLISFPAMRRFLDVLIFKGLEFYSKKTELPFEILSIQKLFHLRCSKMILCVLKGIAQMIGVQMVNEILEVYTRQKRVDKSKRPKYMTIRHVELLSYCLEREVQLRNDELVLAILTDFLFFLTKIHKRYVDMDFSEVAMILNPLLLLILEDYTIHGANIGRMERQQKEIDRNLSEYDRDNQMNRRGDEGRTVLSHKDLKKARRMAKRRVHSGTHSYKTVDELFDVKKKKSGKNDLEDEDEDEEDYDDEDESDFDEDGFSLGSLNEEEKRVYHIITITLQILSLSEFFTVEQVNRIIALLKRETSICGVNPTYQPNSEYIENLLDILVSITMKSIRIMNRDMLNSPESGRRNTQKKKMVDEDQGGKKKKKVEEEEEEEEEEEVKRKNLPPQNTVFEFPRLNTRSVIQLPAYPIMQNDMIDSVLRIISRVFPLWNYLPFKTVEFLGKYRSVIRNQSPKQYLIDHPYSRMELSRHEGSLVTGEGRRNERLNFPLLFRLFQGTIHAHKINWSRGYERRFAGSYPSWHILWLKCLRLMVSLLMHFPKDQQVRKRIMKTIQMNSDRFLYSLFLKTSRTSWSISSGDGSRKGGAGRQDDSGGLFSSSSSNSSSSSSRQRGGVGEYEPRKNRELRHVVDEYLVFTMSELKEAKLVSSLFFFLTNELCMRENEKLLLGLMEGFSHATEMLSRGVDDVIKPFTKRERKVYESNYQLRSYFLNEKQRKENEKKRGMRDEEEEEDEIGRRIVGGPMDQEGEDDEGDRDGEGMDKNETILKRSFKLLEKSARTSWSFRANIMLLDVLFYNMRIYFRILTVEQMSLKSHHKIEVIRKHDISSKNFYSIVELVTQSMKLLMKIVTQAYAMNSSESGDTVSELEKTMKAKGEGESVKNLFDKRDKQYVENNRLDLINYVTELIKLSVNTCLLHLECEFKPGVQSGIHHHRTPEELKDKMRGNFRNVVKTLRSLYQKIEKGEYYKKVFKGKRCRDSCSQIFRSFSKWISAVMEQKFKQVKGGDHFHRKYMGDESGGGGLFD